MDEHDLVTLDVERIVAEPSPERTWAILSEVFLTEPDFATNTRKTYGYALGQWRSWVERFPPLPHPWDVELEAYAGFARELERLQRSVATRKARLSFLLSWARWLSTWFGDRMAVSMDQVKYVTRLTRTRRQAVVTPTPWAHQQRLLKAASEHSPRAAVVVQLHLLAGLRVSEIAAARTRHVTQDFSEGGRMLKVEASKRERTRTVPLVPRTVRAIEEHLAEREFGWRHDVPLAGQTRTSLVGGTVRERTLQRDLEAVSRCGGCAYNRERAAAWIRD